MKCQKLVGYSNCQHPQKTKDGVQDDYYVTDYILKGKLQIVPRKNVEIAIMSQKWLIMK